MATRQKQSKNKYEKCGIYQLICPSCNMKYVGQTGRPFKVRFQEHLRDFKYGNKKSKIAQNLLENKHSIGPMENIMDTIHITNNGRMMDTLEIYYIFRVTKLNSQINDKFTVKPNIIFETIVHKDLHRRLSATYSPQPSAHNSVLLELCLCSHGKKSTAEHNRRSPTAYVSHLQSLQ